VYDGIRDDVVARAKLAGVSHLLNAATEPGDWSACRDLSSRYDICMYALGIHPWYIPSDAVGYLNRLTSADFKGAHAIGEIGLDKRNGTDFDVQIQVFRKQIELAHELDLPVVMHCVSAFQEISGELKRCPVRRGAVIHNFNGSAELAADLSKRNIYFSMGGTLTYRDIGKRGLMLRSVYPGRLLLETDSPDIPPFEKKGSVNEPANILYNARAAARIADVPVEEMAERTLEIFRRLFLFL
jgi:TatD DNase family protein